MPPNTQQVDMTTSSFMNSFWSKDRSGMTQLLDYMKSTHDDLDIIYTIYTQRSQLEHEFGEKLLSLSSIQKIDEKQSEKGGVPAAYSAISMELKKTATSHLELSEKLNSQVASEFEQKLDEYKLLLDKWTKTLEELYNERQEKTIDLLKIRAKYLKEHDISKGQSTSTMDALKSQYKSLVAEVDELSQEWNTTWKDACEVMEAMEEDRVEFLKSNVWEYANLASARLLIEDEWCETIRKQLEKCSAEQEIERCISIYGTGSKIPTTNEYVGEQMREQKKKNNASSSSSEWSSTAPTPPTKPPRQQGQQLRSRLQQQKQVDDKSNSRNRQREEIVQSEDEQPQQQRRQKQHQTQQEDDVEEENVQQRAAHPQKQKQQHQQRQVEHSRPSRRNISQPQQQRQVDDNKPSSRNIPQQKQSEERSFSKGDEERMNHIRSKVSDNMGSTATRGQIKRKPLNKSLMDQVSNQMAMARQQRESEQDESSRSSSPQSSIRSSNNNPAPTMHKKTNSNGSLESLLKTFEVVNPPVNKTPSPPPIAAVSDEARFRRQPSEYKPDSGSIPSRRITNTTSRVLQEITDIPPSSSSSISGSSLIQDQFTHPVAPPKSPRPPAQQISAEAQLQQQQPDTFNDPRNQNYQPAPHNQMQQQQYPASMQPQPSPNMMQQIPDQNTTYSHQQQQQQYMGQPQYMGQHMGHPQQHMGQPQRSPMMQPQRSPMMQSQRSPMMQPQRSPMMQPQRSPMMQPQRSPMMQPQRSPMMQPQRSPMMQPLHSPMMHPTTTQQQQQHFGTQRGGLPPPITIPASNYGASPQPSPAMAYANIAGGVSPGGVLPPPAIPYNHPPQQPRPPQHSDGRPVLFWVRAKYDYTASDEGEISFKVNSLIGILEADMTQQSWWVGAIWDEYRHTWSIAGSIPSNFLANA